MSCKFCNEPTSGQCAQCGAQPTLRQCVQCSAVSTAGQCARCGSHYCSSVCQYSHWPEHKTSCNCTRRHHIHQAAALAQTLFCWFRELTYPVILLGVSVEGENLSINWRSRNMGRYYRFPSNVALTAHEQARLQSVQGSVASLAFFADLLRNLFRGTDVTISEVSIHLTPPGPCTHLLVMLDTQWANYKPHTQHMAFEISSRKGKYHWIIDLSGP